MIQDFYTQSVSPMRYSTGSWGTEPGWSTSTKEAAISASMNPISGKEYFMQGKDKLLADYKLHCASTEDLDEHDRIKWSGKIFDVVFVKDTLAMGHHKSILLKRLT